MQCFEGLAKRLPQPAVGEHRSYCPAASQPCARPAQPQHFAGVMAFHGDATKMTHIGRHAAAGASPQEAPCAVIFFGDLRTFELFAPAAPVTSQAFCSNDTLGDLAR